MGIEPTPSAWKAEVLPLNYTRKLTEFKKSSGICYLNCAIQVKQKVVEGGGFEPPKAVPTDLQSVPVDRLGTPPR